MGRIRPVKTFTETRHTPSPLATAASLARKRMRGRTGKAPRMWQSRLSGKAPLQDITANRPTTIIVVATRKCSFPVIANARALPPRFVCIQPDTIRNATTELNPARIETV
jgi:hypothetical protein